MAREFPALGFDPAPGELGAVDRLQQRFTAVRTALAETQTTLQGVTSSAGSWQGQAADAFHGVVGELPPYLEAAATSMTSAANALAGWHADLAAMQRRADHLEAEAAEAKREIEQARSNPALPALGGLDPTLLVDGEAQRAQAALERAEEKYEEIKERAERLKDEHEDLAEETADKIKAAKDQAPEEPGFFDRVGDILGAPARLADQLIRDNANAIAGYGNYLGDASAILGGLGLVAPPLGVAGLGVSVAAILAHSVAYRGGAQGVTPQTLLNDGLGLARTPVGRNAPGPIGQLLGVEGTTRATPGLLDNLQQYWRPRNPAQWAALFIPGGGGVVGVPAYNHISDGHEIDEKIAAAQAAEGQ
ncbi:MAG: hypothetical protein GEV03_23470 [Streptosporangiales bacterium]|nr:hypothetical protein [Streptosporangiales bacterium]